MTPEQQKHAWYLQNFDQVLAANGVLPDTPQYVQMNRWLNHYWAIVTTSVAEYCAKKATEAPEHLRVGTHTPESRDLLDRFKEDNQSLDRAFEVLREDYGLSVIMCPPLPAE